MGTEGTHLTKKITHQSTESNSLWTSSQKPTSKNS